MKKKQIIFIMNFLTALDRGLHSTRKQFSIISITFFSTRLFYFILGVRFDSAYNLDRPNTYQILDYNLLKKDFFQSIYYLHSEPPLLNSIIGIALNLFSNNASLAIGLLFLAVGWTFTLSLYFLMNWLGASKRVSFFVMLWFILSPSSILYENYLYTSYLEASFLCIAAMFLYRFLKNTTFINGFGFFALLACLILTRSNFHLLWFVFWLLLMLYYYRHSWKKILVVAFFPFLIVALLYIKNYYTFGTFTTSSWLGMNLSRVTTVTLGENERQALVNKVPPIALVNPFASVEDYQKFLPTAKKTGISVLDEKNKPANPLYTSDDTNNYNNILYVQASKQQLNAALQVIRIQPIGYIKGVLTAFVIYFWPSNEYDHINEFRKGDAKGVVIIENMYDVLFYGQFLNITNPNKLAPIIYISHLADFNFITYFGAFLTSIGFYIVMVILILFRFGYKLIKRSFAVKPFNLPYTLTLMFIWLNIIYVTLTSNFLEVGENERFRFTIDAFYIILLALFIESKIRRRRNKHQEKIETEESVVAATD